MSLPTTSSPSPLSATGGRWCILAAAVLWSLSGAFTKILTQETFLGLNSPRVDALLIAFYRVFFAGLVLLPTLRRRDIRVRWAMLLMVASFATMNALFISAQARGTAANAIFLQYTAPMWMYLASVFWLREPADRRSSVAVVIGFLGIATIVIGGKRAELPVIGIALGSGIAYAGVILFLRILKDESPRWLTVVNHLCGALVLLPFVCTLDLPTPGQLAFLCLFGAVQMALPYWLVARGLKVISPQEAGTLTLVEPLLNPCWAYLVAGELPTVPTVVGGGFILGALAYRYWPRPVARKVEPA